MKQVLFITTALLVCLSYNSYSQWTDGGSYMKTNDNVGIGITNPNTSFFVRKDNIGKWSSAFVNRGGPGADIYLSHGGGYGMYMKTHTADGKYSLKMVNKNEPTNVFYNNGRVGLGLAGNVGIGTIAPSEKLHVVGNMRANTITTMDRKIKFGSIQELHSNTTSALTWKSNHQSASQMIFRDKNNIRYGSVYGNVNGSNFGILDGDGNWSYKAVKDNYTAFLVNNSEKLRIETSGKIKIGNVSTASNNYKLFVEGGILSEKVRVAVKSTADWADFVFEEDYEVMPLQELEGYLSNNKHLPNIPSAEDMVKEGLDIATMDAKLLQQIEELWLHVIELNKKNEALEKLVKTIQANK